MDISIIGPVCTTGYGIVTANLIHSLTELGHKIALFPINDQIQAHPKLHESIKKSLENAQMPNFESPTLRIWHQFCMDKFIGHGRHIAFPIFELDRFTEQEKHHLNNGCDEMFVCSEWGKKIIDNQLDEPLCSIIPFGVDREIFYEQRSYRKTTIFANFGKWEIRKGHDILIKAFEQAFNENDDVELWMLPHNPFLNEQETKKWVDLYKHSRLSSKIKIIPPQENHSQVADIMRMVDVGVFPCRAEGWNMEPLELMSCGKRIIATNYSGQTEYLNKDNSHLLEIDGMELAQDGKWFFGQGLWANLGYDFIDSLVDAMIVEHKLKQANSNRINESSIETAKKYTWKHTAETIVSAL